MLEIIEAVESMVDSNDPSLEWVVEVDGLTDGEYGENAIGDSGNPLLVEASVSGGLLDDVFRVGKSDAFGGVQLSKLSTLLESIGSGD